MRGFTLEREGLLTPNPQTLNRPLWSSIWMSCAQAGLSLILFIKDTLKLLTTNNSVFLRFVNDEDYLVKTHSCWLRQHRDVPRSCNQKLNVCLIK